MGLFSGAPGHRARTHLYARLAAPGRQTLAFADLGARPPAAFVIPLPTAAGAAPPRVVDLGRYPHLFLELHRAFPAEDRPPRGGGGGGARGLAGGRAASATLAADGAALIALGLPGGAAVAAAHPAEAFLVVAPLAPASRRARWACAAGLGGGLAAVGVELSPTDPLRLAFPPVYALTEARPPSPATDVACYCQVSGARVSPVWDDGAPEQRPAWERWARAAAPVDAAVDLARAGDLFAADRPLFRALLRGPRAPRPRWVSVTAD